MFHISQVSPKIMTNSYKLVYFNVMALAEPIRWILSYGQLPFEDVRLTRLEWEQQKQYAPFGTLPILEINGKVMHQSLAICRYLANIVGLAGDDAWENFLIDAAVDTLSDMRSKVSAYNKLTDNQKEEREKLKEQLINETVPFYLLRLEETTKNGFLANGKLSWADVYFVALLDYSNGVLKSDVIDKQVYPTLDKIRSTVHRIPNIQRWIQIRPATEY